MKRTLSICPACGHDLQITTLSCAECGLELRNAFPISPFDRLSPDDYDFLLAFLQSRGNLGVVQQKLDLSYPAARKRLDALLAALELTEQEQGPVKEDFQMTYPVNKNSTKASDIIRNKLYENGGRVIVHTLRGLPCSIRAAADGRTFICDKLPLSANYRYEVFDVIVDLLLSQGGRARKGNGRNYKLGEPDCDETTVVGAIAYRYAKAKTGASVFDPVFALAAVLEWAGIASNERGELVLTPGYLSRL